MSNHSVQSDGDIYDRLLVRLGGLGTGVRVLFPESWDSRVREAANLLRGRGVYALLLSDGAPADWPIEWTVASAGNPLMQSTHLLMNGEVDACVAGVSLSSADVLRASLINVGKKTKGSLVSSLFLMVLPSQILGFGDCVVNPSPDARQLATIAVDCADSFEQLTGEEPRVAMLSFSTHAEVPRSEAVKVRDATHLVRQQRPDLIIEGEIQLDAALVPEVAAMKSKSLVLGGHANVLIFPSLEAGNIGYKLVERLAGARVVGPAIQGLARPFLDISRGATADDVVAQGLLGAAMASLPDEFRL